MNVKDLLSLAKEKNASDLFLVAGLPPQLKCTGEIVNAGEEKLTPVITASLIKEIYALAENRSLDSLFTLGDDDFSFSVPGVSRFRVSAYKQRNSLAAVVRIIFFRLPDPAQLHIPERILALADAPKGLILVTGPAGSGKSTTLACMIDRINSSKSQHIITLEDPLEFLHPHKRSIVSQREIHTDTESYLSALRASLRQSPSTILLGEMRDFDTMEVAMTAAETGHLILSTLHTPGAANTVDRIVDVFPPNQQRQISVQLAMVLGAVVSQQLVPALDGGLIPAFEVMTATPAVRNLIRENKTHQLDATIASAGEAFMTTMDASLLSLYKDKKITKETALLHASNPQSLEKRLSL